MMQKSEVWDVDVSVSFLELVAQLQAVVEKMNELGLLGPPAPPLAANDNTFVTNRS